MAGGKTYQVTQVDPLNPHTKGMVYQVNIVGGGTQMEELPEASADNVGQVYQYLGETGSGLTHGFFYESRALGTTPETYGWVAVNVQQGGATNSATTDLSNLTATGANIANWSSNVSNCITEIPQDIKLELNNGTLTLKAGSKVYVPNGVGVYDVVTLTADKSQYITGTGEKALVYYSASSAGIITRLVNRSISGDTRSVTQTYMVWYDTANNVINEYYDDASTPRTTVSFPVALVTLGASGIESIYQVFNGFGYVGSTTFALPGVSVLAPDGRNQDGTLKTYAYTVPSVIRRTDTTNGTYFLTINCNNGAFGVGQYVYDETTNYNYVNNAVSDKRCIVASATTTSGKMSNLNVKTPFHAVDYSNTQYIAHQAMPSSKYIDLTLPSNGGTVIAPDNGYFTIVKMATIAGHYLYFSNSTSGFTTGITAGGANINQRLCIPASKGDVITVGYNLAGDTTYFRFVYANGVK